MLRAALALLPCLVLVLHLRAMLGPGPGAWLVPLAMGFGGALLTVSLARQLLGGRGFLVFWAGYALLWALVAWHGTHFHLPPRPGALVMNLGEISQVPLPGWHEVPWLIGAAAVGLGWLARRPSPPGRDVRLAALAAVAVFVLLQVFALRYQTRDMLRFSQYRDLVRTHGLETAAVLDGLEQLRAGNGAAILAELRRDAAENPPAALPLDPVIADRVIILQIESLDAEALRPEVAPVMVSLRDHATRGLLNSQRTSVSGSSSADFQLLTGLRPLSGIPVYRLGWDRRWDSLPAHAAGRGFAFHAYHGNDRNFWNRGPAFDALGLDFHTGDSMPETEFSRWGRADGDLFRYVGSRVPRERRAVHFLITLSTHAPHDLVIPPGALEGAPVRTRYLPSVRYVDGALGRFLRALPTDVPTLVVLYGDHPSGLFEGGDSAEERPVPLVLGILATGGALRPLTRAGLPVQELPGTFEIAGLHRFLEESLDASAR